ncbi:hypothetical protein BC940DRAFT_294829, partial [Gongronella butleri]
MKKNNRRKTMKIRFIFLVFLLCLLVRGDPVPESAYHTLQLIDAGQWPPADAAGTRGGSTWPNRDGSLPTDVVYRSWDANAKKPGQARDAARIFTGSDGSAYYSADNGRTFTRM